MSWLERRIHSLRSTGKLNLPSEKDFNAQLLADKKYVADVKLTKYLNLSRIPITTFEGIPKLPKCLELIADNILLESLKNISAFPHLRKISLKNSTNINKKQLNLSLVIALPDLVSINGKIIPDLVKKKAQKYPSYSAQLINKGWIAEIPCPTSEELKQICEQYGVEYLEDDADLEESEKEQEAAENDLEYDFEDTIAFLHKAHEDMLVRSQAIFGIVGDEEPFNTQLSELLATHGVNIEPSDSDALIHVVQTLCDSATQ
ncbi:hypothetical protein TVAG_414400 [Trichomonas vaginalis G3]|uniref:Leucine Rich Repeat family protein n=1 Tax=Trichomonas vaginalis (strain ATCC PRA-98 / G3) TaxID=412133 RepID=A2FDQ9_TRIV3|nr:ribonuclease inhibitor domain-containing protein [Trichomonas vaginalis G3]EAX96959.1 hypothetical protein TVAG_414400 [Trichomonas vaginalis G3]KAI5521357.1 ribonuclease inhibitor domain-containing protein [Trichomonas vaginalis G3]|eukprot:XP_001309889.1 hypothetical protein [Trichomonas vaginalis G3]